MFITSIADKTRMVDTWSLHGNYHTYLVTLHIMKFSLLEQPLSLSLSLSSLSLSLLLLPPITEPTTVPSLTPTTSTDSGTVETDISGPLLKRWEIAVIAVNIVIVISLLVIIPLVMACVCTTVWRKRYTKEQRRRARGRMAASYTKRKRPKSMAEHLQLEESDVETVDFGELTQQLAPVHCLFSRRH